MASSKKPGRLAGKTVVLTAAAQGIGRACVDAFLSEGAKVVATDLESQKSKLAAMKESFDQMTLNANEAESVGTLETHFVDVTKKETIKRLGDAVQECHVLFNCAGIVLTDSVLSLDDSSLDTVLSVNLKGMIWMIQEFLPKMLAAGGGVVINMSSVCSSIKGAPNRSSYGISKAAVIGLTKSVAADYITQGIRCLCICPGTVETESWRERCGAAENPEEARKAFIARQPMGRLGRPEEIASFVVLLSSDDSAFVTGSEFVLDGGWTNVHRN